MTDSSSTTRIDRRTLVTGAAWSAPAVMVASALPAYAASRLRTTFSVTSIGATGLGYDLRTSSGPVLATTTVTFRLTVTVRDDINPGSKSLAVSTAGTTGVTVSQTPATATANSRGFTITITVTPNSLVSDLADIASSTITVGSNQAVTGVVLTNINLSAPSGGVQVDPGNLSWP